MKLTVLAVLFCVMHSVAGNCRAVDFRIEKVSDFPLDVRKALRRHLPGKVLKLRDLVARYYSVYDEDPTGTWEVCVVRNSNGNRTYLTVKLVDGKMKFSNSTGNEFRTKFWECQHDFNTDWPQELLENSD